MEEGGTREVRVRKRERCKDAVLLALMMEGGAMSQGCRLASRSWKRQGNKTDSLLQPLEGTLPGKHVGFSLVKPISDS